MFIEVKNIFFCCPAYTEAGSHSGALFVNFSILPFELNATLGHSFMLPRVGFPCTVTASFITANEHGVLFRSHLGPCALFGLWQNVEKPAISGAG